MSRNYNFIFYIFKHFFYKIKKIFIKIKCVWIRWRKDKILWDWNSPLPWSKFHVLSCLFFFFSILITHFGVLFLLFSLLLLSFIPIKIASYLLSTSQSAWVLIFKTAIFIFLFSFNPLCFKQFFMMFIHSNTTCLWQPTK